MSPVAFSADIGVHLGVPVVHLFAYINAVIYAVSVGQRKLLTCDYSERQHTGLWDRVSP
jgi:hypothetical protein